MLKFLNSLNKDIIRIDIDGVIRDFMGSVYTTLKAIDEKKVPNKEPIIYQWDFSSAYPDIPKDKLLKLVFKSKVKEIYYSNAKPYEMGINLLNAIRKEFPSSKIILRTHQSKESTTWTDRWLNKYNIPYDGVFYSRRDIDKNLIPNTVLIDDNWNNIQKVNYGILVSRNWNNVNYKYRSNSVKEIISFIKEIGT